MAGYFRMGEMVTLKGKSKANPRCGSSATASSIISNEQVVFNADMPESVSYSHVGKEWG